MSAIASPPEGDSLIQTDPTTPTRRDPFYMSVEWYRWIIEALLPRVAQTSEVVLSPDMEGGTLTDQHTSIPATPLAAGQLGAGTYRVTYYARKTTIDGVASQLTVSIGFTENAIPLTLSGPIMNVDSVTSPQSGSIMVTIDDNTSITYATTYFSTTPDQMRYELRFLIEAV